MAQRVGSSVSELEHPPEWRLVIRPNCSMAPRTLVLLSAGLAIVLVGIGVSFWWIGAWLILPFAGLELMVVAIAVFIALRHARDYEQLIVTEDRVQVTRQVGIRALQYEFHRHWTQVRLLPGACTRYPSKLTIGSHGHQVEIGASMTEMARRRRTALTSAAFAADGPANQF